MGESAALVALRAWTDRDEMAGRLRSSPLFATRTGRALRRRPTGLGHPARSAGRTGSPGSCRGRPRTCDAAIAASGNGPRLRPDPERERRDGHRRRADGRPRRSCARCGARCSSCRPSAPCIARSAGSSSPNTEALHDIDTVAPPRIAFYSGVSGRRYAVDRRSAAEAIAAQASQPIDFPRTIESAYADGIGLFIEVGPGSSCTRLIDRILGDRPHVAVSACRPDRDPFAAVLDVLAACIAHRVPVDLATLYGGDEARPRKSRLGRKRRSASTSGPPAFRRPSPARSPGRPAATMPRP